jgi:50S ribosomal protein L16 3-hydroxylase
MKPGLKALIHPRSVSQFFAKYGSNEPFVVHGLEKTIRPLLNLPFLASLDQLLKSWPDLVQAHLPDVADEASSIDASPGDARKLFDNGMGLMFNQAQRISPELVLWLETIKKDLGLSELTYSRCLMYATPKGKGTAPHFDQNINFVLQIHGNKKWFLAPNHHVENPLTRHTMGLPVDPELQTYAKTPLPTQMPAGSRAIVLKPGSLLFIPRGRWHSTEANSEALSLNFTYSAPTWLDLFTAALRSRLALSPEWRETADGVSYSQGEHRHVAQDKLDTLLSELTYDLPNWRAEDILGVTDGPV